MQKPIIGWREWLGLPDLLKNPVKCNIDTGASTSSIGAIVIDVFEKALDGTDPQTWVRFRLFPDKKNLKNGLESEAQLLEYRKVRSSNGQSSKRPVILTTASLLKIQWTIEITLADRKEMDFPMLLGRKALRNRFIVDVSRSFVGGPSQSK